MKLNIIFLISILLTAVLIIVFLILKYQPENFKIYKIFIDNSTNSYAPQIVKYILKSVKNYKITDKEEADINVYHIIHNSHVDNKINIVISGEAHMVDKKNDLFIGPVLNQRAKHNIYYPQLYSSLFEHRKSIDNKDYFSKKTKFCAFMYSVDHDHRIKYFDMLSKYKKVDALGASRKNTDITLTRNVMNDKETYNDIAVELYKDYKFVISIENKDVDGYVTEKIINPMIANSIPLYWGSKKVFDYINKKRVIYIPDYTNEQLIEKIKLIDENEYEFNKIIQEPIYIKNPEEVEAQLEREIKQKLDNILN